MIYFIFGTRTYIHVERVIQMEDALGRPWLSSAFSILFSLLRFGDETMPYLKNYIFCLLSYETFYRLLRRYLLFKKIERHQIFNKTIMLYNFNVCN